MRHYPRGTPSPKLNHAPPYAFPTPAAAAAHWNATSQPQNQRNGYTHSQSSSNSHSAAPFESHPIPKRRSAATNHADATHNGSSSNGHAYAAPGPSQGYSNGHSNGYTNGHSNGYSNGSYVQPPNPGPLLRDDEVEELRQWKMAQKTAESQATTLQRIKIGVGALMLMLVLIIVYLVGKQSALQVPVQKPEVVAPEVHSAINLASRLANAGVGAAAPADVEILSHIASPSESAAAGAASSSRTRAPATVNEVVFAEEPDSEAAHAALAEFTAREVERERRELFELDPSALTSRPLDLSTDDHLRKLDPVERATVVVPRPGGIGVPEGLAHDHNQEAERGIKHGHDAAADPHAYAAAHAREREAAERRAQNPHTRIIDSEESPDLLVRLAEAQRMTQQESDDDEPEPSPSARGAGSKRRPRVVHEGSAGTAEEWGGPEGLLTVPAHPAPTQTTHLVIEQLLHEHAYEGGEGEGGVRGVKPHSHRDHPTIPKIGHGIPSIPMPLDPAKKKPLTSAITPASNAAAPGDSQAAQQSHGRKKETPAAAPASATPDLDAPKAASGAKSTSAAVADAPVSSSSNSDESDSDDDLLGELSKASRPTEVHAAADAAAARSNKATGLKGPVRVGANADSVVAKDESAAAVGAGAAVSGGLQGGKTVAARQDLEARRASAAKWLQLKGTGLGDRTDFYTPPSPSTDGKSSTAGPYLFSPDVQLIILTSLKNQPLARKLKTLYTPMIDPSRPILWVSDSKDRGLNATVFTQPHKEWTSRNNKDGAPWRLYELLAFLNDPKRAPQPPPKFYFVMHDITFPLLDQIAFKLGQYLKAYDGIYPNFVGGRKSAQSFEQTFWKEQQEEGIKVFAGKKIMVVPCQWNHAQTSSTAEIELRSRASVDDRRQRGRSA